MSMIIWIKQQYFRLQVKWLIIFKPTRLFDKINQLDWYKNTLCQWVDEQNFATQSKVLEVGCATGTLTTYMAQSGLITTGVDYSSNMVKQAKQQHSDMDFLTANVLDLPFEAGYFDVVIAASLVNIVSDKDKTMQELARVCKKGGRLTILVPSATFSDQDLRALQTSLHSSGFSRAAMEAWHQRAPKMKASEFLPLFKQAGLTQPTTKSYLHGMVIAISATASLDSPDKPSQ